MATRILRTSLKIQNPLVDNYMIRECIGKSFGFVNLNRLTLRIHQDNENKEGIVVLSFLLFLSSDAVTLFIISNTSKIELLLIQLHATITYNFYHLEG